jgi:hypothetical protein
MNETQTRKGPNLGILLLIPAVLIIAKAGRHRREMMEQAWNGSAGSGPHGGIGARSFRLPPRIEAALDAWHTRAHQAPDPTKPEPSAD